MSTLSPPVRAFIAQAPVGVVAKVAATMDRVILEITIERAYGARYLPEA